MIYESESWKEPLRRTARWLKKTRVVVGFEERVLVKAEREIFLGFYAARKLLDTYKVSESINKPRYKISYHPVVEGRVVDYLNRSRVLDNYDLTKAASELRDLTYLANQVIHSYVFEFAIDECGAIEGVFVASDTIRHQRLYYIPSSLMIDIFSAVGSDSVTDQRLVRDPKTGQWVLHKGT